MISEINNHVSSSDSLKYRFVENFAEDGIEKRIKEQIAIGNIKYIDDKIYLSLKGEIYYQIFRTINIVYNTDNRILTRNL